MQYLAPASVGLFLLSVVLGAEPAPPPREADVVRLPEAANANPLGKLGAHDVVLNVNASGQVLLGPAQREGKAFATLDRPYQVEQFLKRRAKEERAARGEPADADELLRSALVLRIDARTPFLTAYYNLIAARFAKYKHYQLRVNRGGDRGEGRFDLALPLGAPMPEAEFVARATSDDTGGLAKLTLRGDGLGGEFDLKDDLAALGKQLANLALRHKGKRFRLHLEVGEKVLYSEAIRVLDTAFGAGHTDVWLFPIDKRVR